MGRRAPGDREHAQAATKTSATAVVTPERSPTWSLTVKAEETDVLAAVSTESSPSTKSVLLPATMKLLGDWNWYLPTWLQWLPTLEQGEPAAEIQPAASSA